MSSRDQLSKAVRRIPKPLLMVSHFTAGAAFHLACGIFFGLKNGCSNWLAEFRMVRDLDKEPPSVAKIRSRIRQNHEFE